MKHGVILKIPELGGLHHRYERIAAWRGAGRIIGERQASGWSASWIMIWVISTWRKEHCSPSKTPSGQKCYLCL